MFPVLLSPWNVGVSWGWQGLWGREGHRAPPAPQSWLLSRNKPRISRAGPWELQPPGKTQLGLGKQEVMETAKGTWQPFDSQQKCSVMFIVKD